MAARVFIYELGSPRVMAIKARKVEKVKEDDRLAIFSLVYGERVFSDAVKKLEE